MGGITNPTSDLNLTLCDLFGDRISKHRTCWLHIVANHYHGKNYITWKEVEKIKKKYRRTAPCFNLAHPRSGRWPLRERSGESSSWMDNPALTTHKEGNKLDTDTFECYIEHIWKNFSEDKRMAFAYLDSLWFSLYRESSTRPKVLTWIKQKSIFSKKYVFVPVVCWGHWSLLILVNLGGDPDSESRRPCMLLLDSLENAEPKRLEPEIRKFVVDIYKAEGRTEDKKVISQIPLIIPKVPQQRDDEECGFYVLYFINLFMQAAPENFSLSDGYPYFMSQDWFKPEDLDSFRGNLEKEIPRKKVEIRATRMSRRKSGRKIGVISVDD
ncbi:putative ubiquitin-like-specific protease 2A [Silene latifolia]|uniref:putative ubiquitin-like-specific protease 2A n=1 Tax=Silene latifolia TaxID=37657 RepID=UPI003D7896BB